MHYYSMYSTICKHRLEEIETVVVVVVVFQMCSCLMLSISACDPKFVLHSTDADRFAFTYNTGSVRSAVWFVPQKM